MGKTDGSAKNAKNAKGASATASASANATAASKGGKKGLVIGIVALVAVIVVAAVAYNALAPAADQSANISESAQPAGSSSAGSSSSATKAPDFVAQNAEGQDVSLASFEGKPVVLNFWASTCGPCKSEMPHFQKAFEKWGDEVDFVMVDIPDFNGESVDRAKQFIADAGYTFPVLFDVSGEASQLYGLSSIPKTFFLDKEGYLLAQGQGALTEDALLQGLEMIAG